MNRKPGRLMERPRAKLDSLMFIEAHDKDPTSVEEVIPKPLVKTLFLGPYALEAGVRKSADDWKARIEQEYDVELDIIIADPPFDQQKETFAWKRVHWTTLIAMTFNGTEKRNALNGLPQPPRGP